MDINTAIFFAISVVTIASACVVAFSRHIIYSAFSLLGVFAGIFGMYIMLSADFVAVTQVVIYIGGILTLIIFAVMFTTKIGEKKLSNRAMEPITAFIGVAVLGVLIWRLFLKSRWLDIGTERFTPTTAAIGNKLLNEYLLPFEIVSLLLVLVLVGAIVLARREVK